MRMPIVKYKNDGVEFLFLGSLIWFTQFQSIMNILKNDYHTKESNYLQFS
ncbi:unnamed protein product [Paramecium octaurelia]|uniref:Uncharacterized protein n=1 Tax=Paramecium octaurelia TaxID=43137 RepID=A0A8S1SS31_PAROT|nr:unnamed protein product [Paramecium octaurelia]